MMEMPKYDFRFFLMAVGVISGFFTMPLMGEVKQVTGMEDLFIEISAGNVSQGKRTVDGGIFPGNLMNLSPEKFIREYEIRVQNLKKAKAAFCDGWELEGQYLLYGLGFKCPERARMVMESREFPYREEWRTFLMQGWAQSDCQGAMDYFLEHKEEMTNAFEIFSSICVEMFQSDPEKMETWGLAQSGKNRMTILLIVQEAMGRYNPERIPGFVQKLREEDLKYRGLQDTIIQSWGIAGFESSMEIFEKCSSATRKSFFKRWVVSISRLDLEKATELFRTYGRTPEEAYEIASLIVSSCTFTGNPRPKREVLEWVVKNMSDHSQSYKLAFDSTQGDRPPSAEFRLYVSSLPDGSVRKGAMDGLRDRGWIYGEMPGTVEEDPEYVCTSPRVYEIKEVEADVADRSLALLDRNILRISLMSSDEMFQELKAELERTGGVRFLSASDYFGRLVLCRRLGQVIPQRALQEVAERERKEYVREIVAGWRSVNSNEAFCYCWSYRGTYSFSPEKAAFLIRFPFPVAIELLKMDQSQDRKDTLCLYLERLAKEKTDKIPEFIQSLEQEWKGRKAEEKAELNQRIAEYWARSSPLETLLWIDSFPLEEQSRMIISAMKGMPWEELDRNLGILNKKTRVKILSEIFPILFNRDSVSALECIRKNLEQQQAIKIVECLMWNKRYDPFLKGYANKLEEGAFRDAVQNKMEKEAFVVRQIVVR